MSSWRVAQTDKLLEESSTNMGIVKKSTPSILLTCAWLTHVIVDLLKPNRSVSIIVGPKLLMFDTFVADGSEKER